MTTERNMPASGKTALFVGGGAPNLTLMSGALLALHEERIKFDIISMAGAGAVVGLVYLAPTGGMTRKEALTNTINFGISDQIYRMFPVNYKVFGKAGPSANAFNDYWFSLPQVRAATHQLYMTEEERLWADWLLFIGALLCPTDVSILSSGLCEHPRLIEDLINFSQLRDVKPEIHISAFNIKTHKLDNFKNRDRNGKKHITADHLRAALSFPFIYPPYKLNGTHYYEGAAFQTLNRIQDIQQIDKFIVLNPLQPNLIQRPECLWDAYTQSIIMPVTGIAEAEMHPFRRRRGMQHLRGRRLRKAGGTESSPLSSAGGALLQVMRTIQIASTSTVSRMLPLRQGEKEWYSADLTVDEPYVRDALGWSRSSLERLFKIGKNRGKELAERIRNHQPDPAVTRLFHNVFATPAQPPAVVRQRISKIGGKKASRRQLTARSSRRSARAPARRARTPR
jgi:NTE family protein